MLSSGYGGCKTWTFIQQPNESFCLWVPLQIARDTGSPEDGLRALLRLLTKQPQSAELRAMLAEALQQERCFAMLEGDLASSPASCQALAFLATAVKDHGAVPTAVKLYK